MLCRPSQATFLWAILGYALQAISGYILRVFWDSICSKGFPGPLAMGPFNSGGFCSTGPSFVYGTELVCLGVQIRAHTKLHRRPLD